MLGMNEKVLLVFTPATLLKFSMFELFDFKTKQTIEISLLSYHLPQCSDGPSNPQHQPGCNDADAADDDGRPRSRES